MTKFISISAAYKHADGKKIDGRRVVVDIERGRTVTGWLPRRLGNKDLFHFGDVTWYIDTLTLFIIYRWRFG